MKYIIIGLGNFGASLAEKLTNMGNEVIGVDRQMSRVEAMKERITHAISLDSTDINAVSNLPLKDTDVVIVAIGEDKGDLIMTTALMKQLKVKRLISRAVAPLQEMVLEAMGVEEIIHPEEESAERWSKKLNLTGVVDSFELTGDFSVVEVKVPEKYYGKKLEDIGLRRDYNLIVLTTIEMPSEEEKKDFTSAKRKAKVQEVASAETILHEGEVMVIYGNNKDIKRLLLDKNSD